MRRSDLYIMSDLENKCLKISKKIEKISQQELASRGLGTNKKINNIILSRMVASRRHKCRVVSDHHETRRDTIKQRLRRKLAAKQKKALKANPLSQSQSQSSNSEQ